LSRLHVFLRGRHADIKVILPLGRVVRFGELGELRQERLDFLLILWGELRLLFLG